MSAVSSVLEKPITKCSNLSCEKVGRWEFCGRCRSVSYCSPVCKQKDLALHRKLCGISLSKEHKMVESSNDIISFIKVHFFSSSQIPRCYQSYKIKGKEVEIEKDIKNHNLKKVLLNIWAEKDSNYRIQWLRKMIEKYPHPILCFELGRYLVIQSILEKNRDVLAEGAALYIVGGFLAEADVLCYKTTPLVDVKELLLDVYVKKEGLFSLESYPRSTPEGLDQLNQKIDRTTVERLRKILENTKCFVDPNWATLLGLKKSHLVAQGQWLSIRTKYLESSIS